MEKDQKLGAIIFSRFDSNRLPGKALLKIEGRSLLGRVIDRTKLIEGISQVILATTDRSVDNPIYEFALKEGINTFRGSCNDVYKRAIDTCKKYNLNAFARICGDRPFLDNELVSQGIKIFKDGNFDLVTTMFPRTYPPGLTTEIMSINLLKKFDKKVLTDFDREHLTTFFYKNPKNIKIKNIENQNYQIINNLRLVVDNKADLERARWIAKKLLKMKNQSAREVLSLAIKYEKHSKM